MENDFISEEYMEFLESISALEKQVADDKLAIAGLKGNIAGSKLREILWKIIGLTTNGDVYVWGQDGLLGTKNELIDKALYIIKNESKNNED